MEVSNWKTLTVQVNTTDEQAEDIGRRICEVIKTEFGATAINPDWNDVDTYQDIVRTSVIESLFMVNYINAYGDAMQTDEFKTYDEAKSAAWAAIQNRPLNSRWFKIEISTSNGETRWFWDGKTAYEF